MEENNYDNRHLRLEALDESNWFIICNLSVSSAQKNIFPIENIYWIAISRYEEGTELFAIKYKEFYVGLIGGGYDADGVSGFINPLMIDERYQNQGYALGAIKLMIKYLTFALHVNKINLGHRKENIIAGKLYEKLGFHIVGNDDKDYFRSLDIKDNY
ncbi:MAG: hypothetical protein K0S61_206 [Anaerocolumna sp.]|jgi:RimJ/RimL family protein N-acetyltransferase|nr:hypothetical protein [Anaerocolumna sp.]